MAVQIQNRIGFQMLITHGTCQIFMQLHSPWDIVQQHKWSRMQTKHGIRIADMCLTNTQTCSLEHLLSPSLPGEIIHKGRETRKTFSCWAKICHSVSVTSYLLVCSCVVFRFIVSLFTVLIIFLVSKIIFT